MKEVYLSLELLYQVISYTTVYGALIQHGVWSSMRNSGHKNVIKWDFRNKLIMLLSGGVGGTQLFLVSAARVSQSRV